MLTKKRITILEDEVRELKQLLREIKCEKHEWIWDFNPFLRGDMAQSVRCKQCGKRDAMSTSEWNAYKIVEEC